jgi:hypothetical protein
MNLRPIPPPVIDDNKYDKYALQCTKAWDSDDHVFYLIGSELFRPIIRIHTKEKGVGGRVINPDPDFKGWEDFYHRTPIALGCNDEDHAVPRIHQWFRDGVKA